VFVALVMVGLMGCAAVVVDVGLLYNTRAALQNSADAAAMAGGAYLPNASDARMTAISYAVLNGVQESAVTVTTPYEGSPAMMEVICTRTVPHTFARTLGFGETRVSARAVVQQVSQGGYAIFAGQNVELILNGGGIAVLGSIHTNGSFKANGQDITVSGTVQAVGTITVDDPSGIPYREPGVDSIELSDYVSGIGLDPDLINAELATATTYYGDRTISVNPGKNVYVKGKVLIATNGLQIDGSIIADGDIYIDATNLVLNSPVIYSKHGKIEVKKGNVTINGTLYSPASEIIFNPSGDPVTLNGKIAGNFVRLNGPGITINATGAGGSATRTRLVQ
jgi:Flp pilus assembly protein TadG